jgi:hypothetical protein
MSDETMRVKRSAPEWLRALNATLTAWNSFMLGCASILLGLWHLPAFQGLGGTAGLLAILGTVVFGVLAAVIVTKWLVRLMKSNSTVHHAVLLVVLVLAALLTLPQPFLYVSN